MKRSKGKLKLTTNSSENNILNMDVVTHHHRLRVEGGSVSLEIVFDDQTKAIKVYEVSGKRCAIRLCAANAFIIQGTRV
jgi:hypothetical protein